MRWLLIVILTLATVVIQLFLFWLVKERDILELNTKLMQSEMKKIEKLESLDRKVRDVLIHTPMKVSDKSFARKKLLTFFDTHKKTFGLSLDQYFKEHKGMLYLQLRASLRGRDGINNFFELFNSSILFEIKSIREDHGNIEVEFNAFYPFKEYL